MEFCPRVSRALFTALFGITQLTRREEKISFTVKIVFFFFFFLNDGLIYFYGKDISVLRVY